MYAAIVNSPIGKLGICLSTNTLEKINFLPVQIALLKPINAFAEYVCNELNYYFQHPAYQFTVPLAIQGTAYRQKVWDALKIIPMGKTYSYGELGALLNTHPRAIGNACRHNPIPIIVPCHRVVKKNSIGGYSGASAGALLDIKYWLLQHEAELIR